MDRVAISEMISAYLDGEVTPAERTEVEQLLETSPEWRTEMDQFARLSDLIRAVPRESAPPELAAVVRQQAERKSLLQPAPAVPKRSLRREWIAALTGMAVTAVGMVIGLRALEQPQPQLASTAAPQADFALMSDQFAETAPADQRENLAVLEGVPASKRRFAREFRLTEAPSMAKTTALSDLSVAAVPAEADAPADAMPESGPVVFYEEDLDAQSGLDRIHIGDVLPYLVRTSDGVAVVELTVVNVEEAGGQLELLLANNGLQVVPESEISKRPKDGAENKQDAAPQSALGISNTNHLMTFYVNAPSGTISQVLDELGRQEVFSRAKLQPPVDSPQLARAEKGEADSDANVSTESLNEGEQSLVQEAIEVSQNYNSARQMTVGVAEPIAEQRPRGIPRQGKLDQQARSGFRDNSQRQQPRIASKSKAGKNRFPQSPVAKSQKNAQDVAAASPVPAGMQISNNFVALELDPQTGQVANLVARQPAKNTLQSLAMKKNAPKETNKAAEGARGVDETLGDAAAESETAADPSIRVLIVVKQAETP